MAAKRADEGPLRRREFAGAGDPAYLLPPYNRDVAPFWDALREGRLSLQHCEACGRARYPVAPVCPHCGGRAHAWREHSGRGTVHSWVRYHRGYLPEFEPLLPYVVLCVALEDGPRLFGRLATGDAEPAIGLAVAAIVERFADGDCVLAFVPAPAE
jgi:uncharacterized protein